MTKTAPTIERPQWTLGDHLRKARQLAGVTREEMAAELGVKPNTVTRWEHDEVEPKRMVISIYVLRCGVPMSWFADVMPADSAPPKSSAKRRRGLPTNRCIGAGQRRHAFGVAA